MNNNIINNNQLANSFIIPQSNIQINEDINQNNNKRIINQNCYQINIENMNIHNSINNISQNYNISTSNDNENNNQSNKSNISIEFKKENSSNTSKVSYNSMNLNDLLKNIEKISENQSGCRLLQNKLQQNASKANDFYRAMESKKILKK